jgi:peptidylprolyl isomerase
MSKILKTSLIIWIFSLSVLYGAPTKPVVVLHTSKGDITLQLFPDVAPLAVKNFLIHVKNGYYNHTIFHRIIKNFMVQGGDPTGTGRGGESIWHKPFKDEFKQGYTFDKAGILAMANAGPNTNGSQFFITVAPARWLNGYYTIFGKVIGSFETLKKLNDIPTLGQSGHFRPLNPPQLIKAYIQKK